MNNNMINCKWNTYFMKLATAGFSAITLLSVIMLVTITGSAASAEGTSTLAGNEAVSTLSKCRADLADRLKIQEADIKLVDAQTVIWPDTALGMPVVGKMYAQVQTPGQKLILQARGVLYLYTTGAGMCRYGGPLGTWAYSMLYQIPATNDPNLNSDLYQCSLVGTNGVRLVSGVADYYPQAKGIVIFKRRTSRSGHDLIHIKANEPGKERMIYQAFDFGDTALNSSQDRWAGYVRERVGGKWMVAVGGLDQEVSKPRIIPLPEGIQPGRIAWSDDTLMIMVKKAKHMVAFEITLTTETPTWKPVGTHTFPGQDAYLLNKSESLVIEQVEVEGKPAVEVACVWFTGDRNVVAQITDFKMQGFDLLGPYAFIWGKHGSEPHSVAYTVNIGTGVSVLSSPGICENIKPFAYPLQDSLIPKAPLMDESVQAL